MGDGCRGRYCEPKVRGQPCALCIWTDYAAQEPEVQLIVLEPNVGHSVYAFLSIASSSTSVYSASNTALHWLKCKYLSSL